MVEKKVRVGISFDAELARAVDAHAKQLRGLGVNRSDIVNALVAEFFEDGGSTEAVWEAVSRRRTKRREG
jgi:metal-responsive CopG/Arc/MetJ family transcriptional regulator